MWHIVRHSRKLGSPTVETVIMPGTEGDTAEEIISLAYFFADGEASDLNVSPSVKAAQNAYQYDTLTGTRITYQAQPISWKVK